MSALIDPRIARAVATRVAGASPLQGSYLIEALETDLAHAVPRSEELVAEVSGIAPPPPVRWSVVDRSSWAGANIAGMDRLLRPLTDRLGARLESLPLAVRLAQRSLLSLEVGALLGYVSRRVLGQYDVLVPEEELSTARYRRGTSTIGRGTSLYFVGPNIVETERRLSFVPADFALWVSVHEVTHRFQFAGVTWLRDHFFGLLSEYLGSLNMDARGLAKRLATAASRLATRSAPPEERHPIYLLASDEQRRTLNAMQALMSVVEGHGNHVMDSVGEDVIPSFRRMRSAFDNRRAQTGFVQRAFNQAIGLEMKLRQYELGQRFCDEVVRVGGRDALARLWSEPAALPSLEELRAPETWLRRVA